MKIGLFSTFMSPVATPEMVADFAVRAENLGVESLWMGEHVVLFDETENPYPGSRDGKIPVPEGGGMLDTVSTFGYIAACTKSIRRGTGITLLPQRNPVYTAKEFTTLDWLSNGRIDLGVGVGWCREEVEVYGFTFEDRGKLCDEFRTILQRLWTDPLASFSGDHYELTECRMAPKPVQKPHIPIIVGGHSKVAFRRAAQFGSGWHGFQLDHDGVADARRRLVEVLREKGRSFDDFELVITPPYRVSADMIKGYEALGVDRLIVHLGNQKPDRVDSRLRDTIKYAAHRGMGSLCFKFVNLEAARAWVHAYYNTFVHHQEKLTDYQTNPNIAVVSGFMCAETHEEAWERADGWTFFQFALQLYGKEGPFEPGGVNFWERYQEWKQTPEGQKRSGSELIGSPDTIRARLKELEDANVDQVILLNQAGKNTHEDICDSLKLFAREVMPEFRERELEHQQWKQAVLNEEITLEDIDTEPFNISRGREPTKPSTKEEKDMVAGVTGRPDSSVIR